MQKWNKIRKSPVFRGLVSGAAAFLLLAIFSNISNSRAHEQGRIFELRQYTTHDGRLPDLNERFRNHTNRLFVKHGMSLIGYWEPNEGPEAGNTLIYILGYPSKSAREDSFKKFRDDPEWKEAYAKSRQNGPIVKEVKNTFLTATDYSPIQ